MVEGAEDRIRSLSRKQRLKWVNNRLTKQTSTCITEFWTKSHAPHIEVGVGGELEQGRKVVKIPYQPLNVQRRVEHSQERKDSQKCKRQCRLDQYFQNRD